jgi:hypothetical protein
MSVNVQGVKTLVSLRTFSLSYGQLSAALDLSKLTSLTDLNLSDCTALPAVTGISKLVNLVSLNLRHCNSLSFSTSSNAVGAMLPVLSSLTVSNNSTLTYSERQQLPALEDLAVYGNDSITTIDCSSWPTVITLVVHDCSNLTTLQGLDKLSLKVLELIQCPQLVCLPELTCSKTLQSLSVDGCTKLDTIYNKLTDFEALRELKVHKSGIGLAIVENTDNDVEEQVTTLLQRPGFCFENSRSEFIDSVDDIKYINMYCDLDDQIYEFEHAVTQLTRDMHTSINTQRIMVIETGRHQ